MTNANMTNLVLSERVGGSAADVVAFVASSDGGRTEIDARTSVSSMFGLYAATY